jgi:hypothetical protein
MAKVFAAVTFLFCAVLRQTTLLTALVLGCSISFFGCSDSGKSPTSTTNAELPRLNKGDLILSNNAQLDVEQGEKDVTHKVQFIVQDGFFGYEKAKKAISVSEGKNGLSAKLENTGESITLSATNTAQPGEQLLTIKGEQHTYQLKVTVKAAIRIYIHGPKTAPVWQNDGLDFEMQVTRRSFESPADNDPSMRFFLQGKFLGEVKLSAEVVKGGKGLTVQFDPETVKGSEDRSKLKIKAAKEADLGEVVVKLTATTAEGKTASASFPLEIRAEKDPSNPKR